MTSVLLYALAASAATFVGGSFALRFRDKLHLILGFSAGAVAGVALFDLLPEAFNLGVAYYTPSRIALFIAFGLFGYLVLDRLVFLHAHDEDEEHGHAHDHHRGTLGALTLSAHSFIDGLAIGVGYQASPAVGLVITAAVLTHDFSDGINTVSVVLRGGGSWKRAFRWLIVDAIAPIAGAAATLHIAIPAERIGLILALFVGSFLYLSASDLIPESHHRHPRALTTFMTLLGAAVIYVVVTLAG